MAGELIDKVERLMKDRVLAISQEMRKLVDEMRDSMPDTDTNHFNMNQLCYAMSELMRHIDEE